MKVCIVSTAPPTPCGIASYSLKLVKALCDDHHYQFIILADKRGRIYHNDNSKIYNERFQVVRSWAYNTFGYSFEIFRSVLSEKPDIVHIQHEYLIFGTSIFSAIFPVLLLLLSLLRKPLIVTMHSVIPKSRLTASFFRKYGSSERFAPLGKLFVFLVTVAIGFFVSKVIVHTKSAKRTLVTDYKLELSKIVVIPHGVDIQELDIDICDAKKKLAFDGKKIVLFFGFVRPSKGIEHLIDAMPIIVEQYPHAILLVVGNYHPHLTPKGVDYLELLKERVHVLGLDDRIYFVSKFVPDRELHLYFAACDVAVFPYIETDVIGASGALSNLMSFNKPIVATKILRFADDIKHGEDGLLVPLDDSASLANAVISIFSDAELKRILSEKLRSKAEGRSWKIVACKTLNVYQDAIKE